MPDSGGQPLPCLAMCPACFLCGKGKLTGKVTEFPLIFTLSICAPFLPRTDSGQGGLEPVTSHFGVMSGLSSQPVAVRKAEEATQTKIGIRCDGAASFDNLADPLGWNINLLGQAILADTHGLEKLLEQKFTGGDGVQTIHAVTH